MKVYWIKLVILSSILALVSLACQLMNGPKNSEPSRLWYVNVTPRSGQSPFTMETEYTWQLSDYDFSIICRFPNIKGDLISEKMELRLQGGKTIYYLLVDKAGSYTIECNDNRGHSASTFFRVEAIDSLPANPASPADPEKPASPAKTEKPGATKIPKPGDFNTAGIWMLFEKGTSDLTDYGVPRQCLPGVNYTHVGGTSRFEIDSTGNIVGDCKLDFSEGNKMRLTGSMTGKWDGQEDEIFFHLETLTVIDAVVNGKAGSSRNVTIYEGTARFNSDVQASGIASWRTECVSSDPKVIPCFRVNGPPQLNARGNVPFVINFNPK